MTAGLNRRIGLGLLVFYGLGVMVGAGIYVLVGAVAAEAGSLAWLAFLVAGALAAPSALSFAELASRVPRAGGEVEYVRAAFCSEPFAALVGLAIVLAGTISAAAVLRGGVGYLTGILPVNSGAAIIVIGLVLTGIAIAGIVESLRFAAVLTLIEVVGLVLVIYAGFAAPAVPAPPAGPFGPTVSAVLAAAALAFFAFIGFEDMVNLAEETIAPERTLPRAILLALLAVVVLYSLVAFVATRSVPLDTLATSPRPLAQVWQAGTGLSASVLSGIAVLAALNGVLAQIVMASRVLLGIGRRTPALEVFSRTHRRLRTPVLGSLLVGGSVVMAALSLPVATLAEISASVLLGVFVLVNVCLIHLKRRSPDAPFRIPASVPWVGALASAAALGFNVLSAF